MVSEISYLQAITFLLFLSLLDIVFTYYNTNRYHKLFPRKNFRETELNPILKLLWKLYGLKKGTIIGLFVTWFLLIIGFAIGSGFAGHNNFFYICFGIYAMVFNLHVAFYRTITKRYKQKIARKKR